MSSDRFSFLKSDASKKNEKPEKQEKINKHEKSEKLYKPEEKTKNRFLNPSKKEEEKKEQSSRFKDLISKKENKNDNEKETTTAPENNRFKELVSKNNIEISRPTYKDRKPFRDDYQEQPQNIFESSFNKNKFSIDNEEMFPTLTEDFDIQPHTKQSIESIVNYKMLSDKIIIQSAFENHLHEQENDPEKKDRIEKALEPLKHVKRYSDRNFHMDIIEKYTLEREIKKQREIEKSFNEWNERRIERLKDSDDYLYRWSEAKKNEMLYCIYTDGLDDYGNYDDSEEEEDISDFNVDLTNKSKKSYSDFSNL